MMPLSFPHSLPFPTGKKTILFFTFTKKTMPLFSKRPVAIFKTFNGPNRAYRNFFYESGGRAIILLSMVPRIWKLYS